MKQWIGEYLLKQKQALDSIDVEGVERAAAVLVRALESGRGIFVFGNGGSAANASHFATDLGKGASDALESRRFRVCALADNASWITALGNDYAYDRIFVEQLRTLSRPGDVAMALSVSGNSPNVVRAVEWAREHGLETLALVGRKGGKVAGLAQLVLRIGQDHYGRVEDAQMGICHMLCYAFIEGAAAPSS